MLSLFSFQFFLFLIKCSIADERGNYVASRGTLYCNNRPFRGIVILVDPEGVVWSVDKRRNSAMLDWAHTDVDGTFELLGQAPEWLQGPLKAFQPQIYVDFDCKEENEELPLPEKINNCKDIVKWDKGNWTFGNMDYDNCLLGGWDGKSNWTEEFEERIYAQETKELSWIVDYWAEEQMHAVDNKSPLKNFYEDLAPKIALYDQKLHHRNPYDSLSSKELNDNSPDTFKNYIYISIPAIYLSKDPIPNRFFELGRLNLGGRIERLDG